MENVVIAGAGLVGSLLALSLGNRGLTVDVYERRQDMRKLSFEGGRSINLALSDRGWKALKEVGIDSEIEKIGIPMYGRMIHNDDGSTVYQAYGEADQAIYSVSRGALNWALMDAAEKHPKVNFYFDEKCDKIDTRKGSVQFTNTNTGEQKSITPNLIFGADGAFSKVRYSMQRTPQFNYSQSYLPHGYKELHIPAAQNGGFRINKNALHIWPRHSFMLIALPNLDGSFTCTLFLSYEGEVAFDKLKTAEDVAQFFNTHFADAVPHMPNLIPDFFDNPVGSLLTVRCSPWIKNDNIALIGDASHAIVPFYGQGMNSGFEDCTVLNACINEFTHNNITDWQATLAKYQELRIPDANAIADLALRNFIEMRDLVADPMFLLRKKIAKRLYHKYGERFIPLYSMVTFSHIRYSDALARGKKQDGLLDKIMALPNIEKRWDTGELDTQIEEWMTDLL